MSSTWKTKYGSRRVRQDPPTLKEAIAAAQGLSDELQDQIEIAASLMDLPVDEVRTEMMKLAPDRKAVRITLPAARERSSAARTVIVERKPARRFVGGRSF